MVTPLDPSIPRYPLRVEHVGRMVDLGILDQDDGVELLAGELVLVSPQGPEHASSKRTLGRLLRAAFGETAVVLEQDPIACGPYSLPEPDLAVVRGSVSDYRTRHPRGEEALLVVEIARTSQRVDESKAMIYARAGVPEYWLIDLPARTAKIHRTPRKTGYEEIERLDETASLALRDGTTIPLRELLP